MNKKKDSHTNVHDMAVSMRNLSSILIVLILAIHHSIGEMVLGFGRCPIVETKENFNATAYLGEWFEYSRFPNTLEFKQECVRTTYTDAGDGALSVRNDAMFRLRIFGRTVLEFPVVIKGPEDYLIMETDYENYSLVFSCQKTIPYLVNVQTAWILTRERGVITSSDRDDLERQLEDSDINPDRLVVTEQTDCDRLTLKSNNDVTDHQVDVTSEKSAESDVDDKTLIFSARTQKGRQGWPAV